MSFAHIAKDFVPEQIAFWVKKRAKNLLFGLNERRMHARFSGHLLSNGNSN